MQSVCWNGCSFTVGEGFPENLRDQYIYDRLVSREFNFNSTNIAVPGASNHEIFMRSARAILDNDYDIVFIQWSSLNRIWLYPGPECCFFLNDERFPDFKYRDIYIDSNTKLKLKNTLLLLNHDYHNILSLIDYCCILTHMSLINKTKVIFINGVVPWTDDLIRDFSPHDLTKQLSEYTKSILDFDNRDDIEIIKFFQTLRKKFQKLDQKYWVNIFESMHENTVDTGPEGHHPGIITHQWMANRISEYITRNNYQ